MELLFKHFSMNIQFWALYGCFCKRQQQVMRYERTFFYEKREKIVVSLRSISNETPSFLRESLEKLSAKRPNLKHKPLKWVYNFELIILKSSQDVFAAVSSHFSRFYWVGRTHTSRLNSINLSYKYTGVAWRELFPRKNNVLFFKNFAKILKTST